MTNEKNTTLNEYLYMLLAEKCFSASKYYKLSTYNTLVGASEDRRLSRRENFINILLSNTPYKNPVFSTYNNSVKTPVTSFVVPERIRFCFLGQRTTRSAFVSPPTIDIENFSFPAILYPIYIALILCTNNKPTNYTNLCTQSVTEALFIWEQIINNYQTTNFEHAKHFNILDKDILHLLYIHIVNFLLPNELFELLRIFDLQYSKADLSDKQNFNQITYELATKFLFTTESRNTIYGHTQNLLERYTPDILLPCEKISGENKKYCSYDILTEYLSHSYLYQYEFQTYHQIRMSYSSYTLDMLINELKK